MTMKVDDGFAILHPIDTEHAKDPADYAFKLPMYQPTYHRINNYGARGSGNMSPEYYTSWRDELLAAQETCVITTNLNPFPLFRISGPDAAQFMKDAFINNIDRFPVGSTKHGIVCTENGNIAWTGVILRSAEDAFECQGFSSVVSLRFASKSYDATFEDLTSSWSLFQLMGPRSLEIVEEACQEDFHDLKMCRFKESSIDGMPVRVLRFGMTGGLAYEVHGSAKDAQAIHKRLVEVGNGYGIRLLGHQAYMMSHTFGGCWQFSLHYVPDQPREQREALLNRGDESDLVPGDFCEMAFEGSKSDDMEGCKVTPYDIGLEKIIDFSHDFVGRDALLELRDSHSRTGVSLEWNADDIIDIYRSQYMDEVPYQQIEFPGQSNEVNHKLVYSYDRVLDAEGGEIGFSSGRTFNPYFQATVSLASVDLAYAELGTEVHILWGDPGTRQKKVRATVAPLPYNDHYSNRTFDVEQIPHLSERGAR